MAQDNFTIDIKIWDVWTDFITLKEFILCEVANKLYLLENDN